MTQKEQIRSFAANLRQLLALPASPERDASISMSIEAIENLSAPTHHAGRPAKAKATTTANTGIYTGERHAEPNPVLAALADAALADAAPATDAAPTEAPPVLAMIVPA